MDSSSDHGRAGPGDVYERVQMQQRETDLLQMENAKLKNDLKESQRLETRLTIKCENDTMIIALYMLYLRGNGGRHTIKLYNRLRERLLRERKAAPGYRKKIKYRMSSLPPSKLAMRCFRR